MMSPEKAARSLPELLDALAELPTLPPVERARRARAIANRDAKSVLAAVADAAVVEATRGQTYAEVAEALGVSESAINKAVIRHNARAVLDAPDATQRTAADD